MHQIIIPCCRNLQSILRHGQESHSTRWKIASGNTRAPCEWQHVRPVRRKCNRAMSAWESMKLNIALLQLLDKQNTFTNYINKEQNEASLRTDWEREAYTFCWPMTWVEGHVLIDLTQMEEILASPCFLMWVNVANSGVLDRINRSKPSKSAFEMGSTLRCWYRHK